MHRILLILLPIITNNAHPTHALKAAAAASTAASLKDYSGVASALFNNIRTPAALISGSIVPMGIVSAPKIEGNDSPKMKMLKRANLILSVSSLLSEIISITYSTVAINKLAEIKFEHTESVSDLISSHHELAWVGTNIHFLFGLFGFGVLAISKSYILYGKTVGDIVACWGSAAMLFCMSIVNRGIAQGSSCKTVDQTNCKLATNIFTLSLRYLQLVLIHSKRSITPVISIAFLLFSIVPLMRMFQTEKEKAKDR